MVGACLLPSFFFFIFQVTPKSSREQHWITLSFQTTEHDSYLVLLRRNGLPMRLLDDATDPNLRTIKFVRVDLNTSRMF